MKISYNKRFHPTDGTVYDQTISMTCDEFHNLQHAFDAEIQRGLPRKHEYIDTNGYEVFMKMIVLQPTQQICYMNNTQRRFAGMFIKLPLKNRNTAIIIR